MKHTGMKKILAGVLVFALGISGLICLPKEAQASDTSVVKYQTGITYATFKECIDAKEAPACTLETDGNTGYLFAGWYEWNGTDVGQPIENSTNYVNEEATFAAKFVPAYLTGIACQVKADIENTDVTSTNLRVVSLVDSANYQAVGFNVYGREYDSTTDTWDEWLMYQYDSETTNAAESTKVYSSLNVYKMEGEEAVVDSTKVPADVFGAEAADFKFTTMSLTGIPKASYGTTIAIKPYWITLDGTVVEGMGEFNRVQDSIDEIVNISVNIKDATAIAAGLLEVSYDSTNFTYAGYEAGRVFEEVYLQENTVGRIRCLGNVSDITTNAAEPNDVFVNLRFTKTSTNSLATGAADFAVTIPTTVGGFSDKVENVATVSIWDVKY